MRTTAYEKLQKRLASSGRDYFEGFSSCDFEGLTDAELKEALDTLTERAQKGDGVSLDALRQALPAESFYSFAESLLSEDVSDLFSAQLATSICESRYSESAWSAILRLLRHSDASGRRWLINKLPSVSIPSSELGDLLRALSRLIEQESDHSLLLGESVLLLSTIGLTPRSPQFVEYAKRLQSPDQQERRRALVELGHAG